jgi:branched-chain amino acid transport system permease protein
VLGGLVTARLAGSLPAALAALIAVAVVMVVAAATGRIAIGRPGRTTPVASLIITIGLDFVASAVELLIFGDNPLTYSPVAQTAWSVGGVLIQPQYVLLLGFALLLAGAVNLLVERTILGHALTACAESPRAAQLIGLNARLLGVIAFTLAGLLGAVGGLLLTPIVPVTFDSDVTLAVNAFVAAVFGGLISISGALAGGLALGVGESLVSGYISGQYDLAIALVLLLVVMVARAGRHRELAAG